MNILQLTRSLHKGGVESHIFDLSSNLICNGHKSIVGSDNCEQKTYFTEHGISVIEIDFMTKNPISLIKNIRKLNTIIMKNEIDVVHCHWRICCFYMKLYNIFYKKKIPYVWTCHLAGMKNTWLLRKLSFFDKYIIGVSSDCSNMVIDKFGISNQRVKTIYNGISILSDDQHTKGDSSNVFNITILSRMNPIKNHACMLRALRKLVKEYKLSNIHLNITGSGNDEYKKELLSICNDLEIKDYVDFCGYVNAYDILKTTNVMVLPSNLEGFPISVLEAFNMRVPVVRTRTGGYNDVKDYCWDFDFDNDEQLADVLFKIYTQEIDIQTKVDAAFEFLKTNCAVDVMTKSIVEIYKKAIDEK